MTIAQVFHTCNAYQDDFDQPLPNGSRITHRAGVGRRLRTADSSAYKAGGAGAIVGWTPILRPTMSRYIGSVAGTAVE